MHELSICQALIDQLENLAKEHRAERIIHVCVQVGPLSGAEIPLLERAYPFAASGSVAESAELQFEATPLIVSCESCQSETQASSNQLVCGQCGDYRTRLVSGDEMTLKRVEFEQSE